ncbi:MAG: 4-hydroxybenzoate decarboxylase [Acidobacteria bacterium RIFCSPLOWO2_02_FULL_67_21]|nr:MAG: 4-hydroxybenzoate decarboxylase [Acidobacteria bacterium RIFCSPLOWO2_02_FULL_67_21]
MPKDLRSFLQDLIAVRPGDVKRVSAPVDPRFGATAVAERFARANQYPALYFEQVGASRIPLVLNLTATYDRLAVALETTLQELVPAFGDRMTRPIASREVPREEAPVKAQVWRGGDVDLGMLPLLTHNELDGGPYITSGIGIMRDPESGRVNAGIYRHQVHSRNELGVWFIDTHHGAYIHRRYEERGQPAPIVIAIGHHPAVVMGAVCRIPGMGGEFDAAGALLDESLEVTRAETCDLPVPARAEIVIEGEVIPHGRRDEGPFGEWPGHYTERGPKPVIRVTAITTRQRPIYYDIFSANREHLVLGSLPRMGSIYRNVKQVVPGVRAVNVPAHSRMHCYIAIRKERDAEVKKAAFAALNTEPENLKMIVVVDEDINVFNDGDVMWAIGTRFDAARDLLVIPRWSGPGGLLPVGWDYHQDGSRTARMVTATVIDATKPLPPAAYPPRAAVPAAAVDAATTAGITDLTRLPE